MLVKLIEVKRGMRGGTASLGEIYINSDHIVSVSADHATDENMVNEAKQLGLIEGVSFSRVVIVEGNQTRTLTVVGAPADVYGMVRKKQVLRG